MRTVETKRFLVLGSNWTSPVSAGSIQTTTWRNIFAPMSTGAFEENVIGDEFIATWYKAKGNMVVDWSVMGTALTAFLNVWIVASRQSGSLTPTAVPALSFIQSSSQRATMDGDYVTVIKARRFVFHKERAGQIAATGQQLQNFPWSIKTKFRGKKKFEDDSGTTTLFYLKGWNYHLVVQSGLSVGGQTAFPLTTTSDEFVYFKDP